MSTQPSPWKIPVLLLAIIGSVSVGSILFLEIMASDSEPYPDRPDSFNESNVIEFVTEYERVYANEELSRQYGSVRQITYEVENKAVPERTKNGYLVHLQVTLRWNTKHVEGDRRYVANYFVNNSVVVRAESDSISSPSPDPRTNGTIIDR